MSKFNQMMFVREAEEAIRELAAKHGVQINFRERENGESFGVTISKGEDDARKEFELYARRFGYPPEWFGMQFEQRGAYYKIVGVRPSAETNCFKIRRLKDDKEFVCGVRFVDPMFGLKRA